MGRVYSVGKPVHFRYEKYEYEYAYTCIAIQLVTVATRDVLL